MTLLIIIVFVLLAGMGLDVAFLVLFQRWREGKFVIVRDDAEALGFVSGVGRFNLYSTQQKLGYTIGSERGSLPFDALSGVQYRVEERRSLLMELFAGFDLTDFMQRYRDTRCWYSIAVVTRDGRHIPLYLASRWQQREFLMRWYFNWRDATLIKLGWLKDLAAESEQAYERIRARLGDIREL